MIEKKNKKKTRKHTMIPLRNTYHVAAQVLYISLLVYGILYILKKNF